MKRSINGASIAPHIPNAITITRLFIAVLIGLLLIIPHAVWVAQLLVIVGIVSDKADGTLARLTGHESERGKQLETIIDPLFGAATIGYLWLVLDLPSIFIWIGLILLGSSSIARFLIFARLKLLFYEKSTITRVGVGLIGLLSIFYLFQLPGRLVAAWVITGYMTIVAINYWRMMFRFVLAERRRHSAEQNATGSS